jgi:predicted ester cyclase
VFEGETLVLDPDRDNLVLGYVRLRSAGPDIGHFADAMASPLMERDQAMDMVERYTGALNAADDAGMREMLATEWVGHGLADGSDEVDAEGLQDVLDGYRAGLSDVRFDVDDVHVSDDVVTVIGRVRGTHTGELLGIAPTGRAIEFKAIAVHRVSDGRIVES